MNTPRLAPLCLLAIAAATSHGAFDLDRYTSLAFRAAQEHAPEEPVADADAPLAPEALDRRPSLLVDVEGNASYRSPGGVDETDGDLSIYRAGAGVSAIVFAGDNLVLRGSFAGEYTRFEFDDVPRFIPGVNDTVDDAWSMFLNGFAEYSIDRRWSIVGGGSASWGWEDGASLGSAVWGALYLGAGYRFDEDFKITLGAGVITRLDDDPFIIPYVSFEWRLDEHSLIKGNGVTFEYIRELSPEWDVFVRTGWRLRQYRLNDRKVAVPNGTASDFWVPLTLGVTWSPSRTVELSAGAGAVVYEFIRFRNDGGIDRETRTVDPGALVEVRLTIRF